MSLMNPLRTKKIRSRRGSSATLSTSEGPDSQPSDSASKHTSQQTAEAADLEHLLEEFDSSPAAWFNSDQQQPFSQTAHASKWDEDSPAVFYDGEPSAYYGKPPFTDRTVPVELITGWRQRRLEAAYATGKRNFSVKQVAGDTRLSRKEVLEWVKSREARKQSDLAEQPSAASPPKASEFSETSPTMESTPSSSFADRHKVPGAGDFSRKRLSKFTEATLEKVYSRYSWPPNDMINSITELHPELSAKKIKFWFEERRRNDPSRRRY